MSKIEWTDVTWNPVTGCTKVSPGCKNCYAERLAPKVFAGQTVQVEVGSAKGGYLRKREFTDVRTHDDRLDAPLHWKKPRMVFVNSMSDLFHEDVPFDFIDNVFAVMDTCPQHTFQILTKRAQRMYRYFAEDRAYRISDLKLAYTDTDYDLSAWPLKNVWLGVSVEDQPRTDERIPLLLQTPAAVRFLSCEPLLGPIDLGRHLEIKIHSLDEPDEINLHWVIVGGESGPGARRSEPEWFHGIRHQCQAAGVPYFLKQTGSVVAKEWGITGKGEAMQEWPEEFRVRQFPASADRQ